MHRRLLFPVIFLIVASAVLCALPGLAQGATIAQKKAQAQHIAAQVSALNTKMEFAVEAYDAASQKLDTVRAKIVTNQRQLNIARYNLLIARQLLTQHVVSMYKQDKASVLDVLLSTKSFNEPGHRGRRHAPGGPERQRHRQHHHRPEKADRPPPCSPARRKQAGHHPGRPTRRHQGKISSDLSERQSMLKRRAEADRRDAGRAGTSRQTRRTARRSRGSRRAGGGQIRPAAGLVGRWRRRWWRRSTSSAGSHSSAVSIAAQYLGVPYVWGGASPSGFDCSGLAMYVYAKLGISLPHNAAMQYASITHIAHGSEQPGDLMFFGPPRAASTTWASTSAAAP